MFLGGNRAASSDKDVLKDAPWLERSRQECMKRQECTKQSLLSLLSRSTMTGGFSPFGLRRPRKPSTFPECCLTLHCRAQTRRPADYLPDSDEDFPLR